MASFMDVSGQWDIVQDNGFRVLINVRQTNDQLSATASHSAGKVLSTEATGVVRGPEFDMTITETMAPRATTLAHSHGGILTLRLTDF